MGVQPEISGKPYPGERHEKIPVFIAPDHQDSGRGRDWATGALFFMIRTRKFKEVCVNAAQQIPVRSGGDCSVTFFFSINGDGVRKSDSENWNPQPPHATEPVLDIPDTGSHNNLSSSRRFTSSLPKASSWLYQNECVF